MFQSHLGSIQTWLQNKPKTNMFVSIPPWFDSNFRAIFPDRLHPKVSIPPWFDSNNAQFKQLNNLRACFNPTLVRFKLRTFKVVFNTNREFQSHLGSIQTNCPKISYRNFFQFQSHLGSIQTREKSYATICAALCVSIPPWFDSNVIGISRTARPIDEFQSHLGSIQTLYFLVLPQLF